jgi:hypothetical protein
VVAALGVGSPASRASLSLAYIGLPLSPSSIAPCQGLASRLAIAALEDGGGVALDAVARA